MNADAVARMQQSLMTIKTAAVRIQKQHHDLVETVSDILDAVHQIERELLAAGEEVGIQHAVQTARRPGAATKAKEYSVEKVGGMETLSERRLDSPYPFRAPREVLDAVVDTLAKAEEPPSFHQICEKVADLLGRIPPEYAVRLCLRFLGQDGVQLVRHSRTRFSPVDRGKFRATVKAALTQLKGGLRQRDA